MTDGMNQREAAAGILYRVLEEGAYSHIELQRTFQKEGIRDRKERAFVTRVCMGTLERLYAVDAVIAAFSKVEIRRMKPYIRTILRMSIYQLRFMDQMPAPLVCNEAVRLVRKKGLSGLAGFVNGVLRAVVRSPDIPALPDSDSAAGLSVRYSMPEWLIRRWNLQYGTDTAGRMLDGFYREKQVCVRCNRSRIGTKELSGRLEASGIRVKPGAYVSDALILENVSALEELPEFRQGLFQIQDESSMLVGLAAGYRAGDFVLDLCAAPGGKAIHAADTLRVLGGGHVEARDISRHKCDLIEENRSRAGFSNLSITVWDALKPDGRLTGRADVVLCDLPCSGLGIIGRKPEIKYRVSEEQMSELASLQRRILTTAAEYVKPDGILIYSTCTINPQENEENVQWLLTRGFRTEDLRPYLPQCLHEDTKDTGYLQLLPGIHASDGFFLARCRKSVQAGG